MSRAQRRALARGSGNRAQGGLTIQQAPVAVSQSMGSSRPQISSDSKSGDLRVRVRHREYIKDIAGSVAYAVEQIAINPGLSVMFPWLSQMAGLFESYKFNQLSFEYKTESATTAKGKVVLSVDWDAADAAPLSKQLQLQERTKLDCSAWAVARMNCDQADLWKFGPQRYVRSGAVANTDIKTYDVGNLNVGTQGMADTSAVGELYVAYDVELITPNQAQPSPPSLHINGDTPTSASMLGAQTPTAGSSPLATVVGNVVTFAKAGSYLVEYLCDALTTTSVSYALSAGSSYGSTSLANNATSPHFEGNATGNFGYTAIVNMLAGGTLTLSNTIVTGATASLLIVPVAVGL